MSANFSYPWNLLKLNPSKSECHNTHIHTWDLKESDFEPIAGETIAICEQVYKEIGSLESNSSLNLIEVIYGI